MITEAVLSVLRRRFAVTVLQTGKRPPNVSPLQSEWELWRDLCRHIPTLWSLPENSVVYSSFSPAVAIGLGMRLFRPAMRVVYHYHGIKAFPYTARYRNPLKVLFQYGMTQLVNLLHGMTERLAFRYADSVIVPSHPQAEMMRRQGYRGVRQLDSYVDLQVFRWKKTPPRRAIRIGFVGRIAVEKGIVELVHACGMVADRIEGLHVTHIEGMNEYILQEIQGLCMKYGIRLRVYRNATPAEVAALLQRVDCMVLPSYSEQFPLALLESLATGTPCLATDVGECGRILSRVDRRLILPNHRPATIAQALEVMMGLSLAEWRRISRKGRAVAAHYSRGHFAKRVEQLFRELSQRDGSVNPAE